MAEPFLGEIRLLPIGFAPRGWAACNGQLLSIQGNQALFSLLGVHYGGDGRNNFALPNLRGRVPLHASSSQQLGQSLGEEAHTLTLQEMPQHHHLVRASIKEASAISPRGNVWAQQESGYGAGTSPSTMNAEAISLTGRSQAHSNMQPYLALHFCIALQGIYPPRS